MSASPSSLRILLALESSGPGGAKNMVLQLAVALRPVVEHWLAERLDHPVGDEAPAVVAVVDDQRLDRACQRMGIIYTDEHELNRLIGQRIRSHRLAQNLTLRQLSDRTDLTTSQLSQVELGKNAASIWALARISNSLGLQVSELLSGL